MGLYFRKSLGLGPLRLNASKGGLGLSAGVRGARLGVDARGRTYVHCGLGGIYYRSFLDGGGREPAGGAGRPARVAPMIEASAGPQQEIESGDVSAMIPDTAAGLLGELQRRMQIFSWHVPYAFVVGGLSIAAFSLEYMAIGGVTAALAIIGTILLAIWTRHRRRFRIDYRLDADFSKRYAAVLAAFERLRLVQRIWLVESEASVHNRKYHAGASKTVRRTRVVAALAMPSIIKSNIAPPMIPAGRQRLYLLPDRILITEGRKVGAVEFHELQLDAGTTRFIEDERPPTDAEQVDRTWKFVNKKGGPDRRFSGNRELPIMHYGKLRWSSPSGLNELHQVSSPAAAMAFAAAVAELAAGLAPSLAPTNRLGRR